MAALAAEVAVVFDAAHPPTITQVKGEADSYFKGGLAHHTAGILNVLPLATEEFAGVIMGLPQGVTNPITLNDLVYIAINGRFFFSGVNYADANYMNVMAMPAANLFDNPADLVVNAAGTAGGIGVLDHVSSTGVNGWLDISRRSLPINA